MMMKAVILIVENYNFNNNKIKTNLQQILFYDDNAVFKLCF